VDLERLLDKPPLRHLRTAVATIRAIMFVGTVMLGAGVLVVLAGKYLSASPKTAIALAILLVLLLAVSSYAWFYVTRAYDPPFYEILKLEGTMVIENVNSHRRYTYTRKQQVKATRDDLRLIEFRAHWTGTGSTGTAQVVSLFRDHALLDGRRAESDGRVHRWVYPRRPLGRGQALEVGIQQVHEDDINQQLPYFREGGGRYKTSQIVVTVRFPRAEDPPEGVRGVIWNTNRVARQSPEVGILQPERYVDPVAGTVDYTVTIGRPKLYHSYGMRWSWQDLSDV
jgi:hypothetical protein